MRTSKPFATITYNSNDFLVCKLDDLVKKGKIDFYSFVHHLPEEDETKEHKHLYIVPSSLMDANSLIEYLQEFDGINDKPLTCIAPRPSKFGDWFLYGQHDKIYLASKGQSRKYTYGIDEFICSDQTYFSELRHSIDYTKINRLKMIADRYEAGESLYSMTMSGLVPIQQLTQVKALLELGFNTNTERGDYNGHEE